MIGKKFKHFKGGIYEVIALAKDCDDPNRELVIYRSMSDQQTWARNMDEFTNMALLPDGTHVKRFTELDTNIKTIDIIHQLAKELPTNEHDESIVDELINKVSSKFETKPLKRK